MHRRRAACDCLTEDCLCHITEQDGSFTSHSAILKTRCACAQSGKYLTLDQRSTGQQHKTIPHDGSNKPDEIPAVKCSRRKPQSNLSQERHKQSHPASQYQGGPWPFIYVPPTAPVSSPSPRHPTCPSRTISQLLP
jgi:hypothetical protein